MRRGPRVSVVCVRVVPTVRPLWEVTFALHPGNDVHDATVCAVERQSLVRLIESTGPCAFCGDVGLVLGERGRVDGMQLCEVCVGVRAYQLVAEEMAMAGQRADGERRN